MIPSQAHSLKEPSFWGDHGNIGSPAPSPQLCFVVSDIPHGCSWETFYIFAKFKSCCPPSNVNQVLLGRCSSWAPPVREADTLLALGISQRSTLAAWGESSGGLLVAAAVNLRPELFKATPPRSRQARASLPVSAVLVAPRSREKGQALYVEHVQTAGPKPYIPNCLETLDCWCIPYIFKAKPPRFVAAPRALSEAFGSVFCSVCLFLWVGLVVGFSFYLFCGWAFVGGFVFVALVGLRLGLGCL